MALMSAKAKGLAIVDDHEVILVIDDGTFGGMTVGGILEEFVYGLGILCVLELGFEVGFDVVDDSIDHFIKAIGFAMCAADEMFVPSGHFIALLVFPVGAELGNIFDCHIEV